MAPCRSLTGLSILLTPLYSSPPSQQSHTPSLTRELGITLESYEEQWNTVPGQAEVEGSSDPSWQSQ